MTYQPIDLLCTVEGAHGIAIIEWDTIDEYIVFRASNRLYKAYCLVTEEDYLGELCSHFISDSALWDSIPNGRYIRNRIARQWNKLYN